jgi:ABC-type amino acid transport system permease subunit
MKYDWSVIWQYRDQLAEGVAVTILLTVITMVVAIPGGIAVMMLRQSKIMPVRWLGTTFRLFC